jgi:integrase
MKDLTARQVMNQRAPGKHRVSRNLYQQVTDAGAKSWLFRYMRNNLAHWHGLGSCDLVSLAEARDKAIACRKLLLAGIDPIEHERAQKVQALLAAASTMTFRECGEAYIRAHEASWRNDKHRQQWRNTLDTYVFPVLGALPVQAVDVGLVMKVLEIWHEKPETASRVRGRIEAVLDWATVRGYRQGENPARWRGHLDQLLPKKTKVRKVRHHPAMPYLEVPGFMARLRAQDSISARALEFTILAAVRTNETIHATWDEIDPAAKTWTIPGRRMKSERPHRVPLTDRMLEILASLAREQSNPHLFIGARNGKGLSDMAMLELLRGMDGNGYTVHGFRSSFRDWCAEMTNYPRELAEAALAHVLKDKTEASYQRGDLFEKRRKLMRTWAGYCASLPRTAGDVVAIAEAVHARAL